MRLPVVVVAAAALVAAAAAVDVAASQAPALHRPVIINPVQNPSLTGQLDALTAVLGKEPDSAREVVKEKKDPFEELEEDDVVFDDDVVLMGKHSCDKLPSEGGRRACHASRGGAAPAKPAPRKVAAPPPPPSCSGLPMPTGDTHADLAAEIARYEALERACKTGEGEGAEAAPEAEQPQPEQQQQQQPAAPAAAPSKPAAPADMARALNIVEQMRRELQGQRSGKR